MTEELSLREIKAEWHGTWRAYAIGFFGSLLLTLLAFSLVTLDLLSGHMLVITLVGLALTQGILQLLFFLHLGQEASPRWETVIFFFMLFTLLLIALGSLWIMHDLNLRVMEMSHD